jgi:hypothetical protein
LANELEAKRLHLLHHLVPQAQRIAVFVNPEQAAICSTRARVRALWGLSGWRGNERIGKLRAGRA